MRTLHLIESDHTSHPAAGVHSFFSITLHVAILVAALWATTRTAVERTEAPDPRVYFVPEARPVTRAPAPAPRQAAPRTEPSKAAPTIQPKVAAPAAAPVGIPAPDVPLADPSATVAAEPSTPSGEP